jgi:pumilio family protein 6
MAKIVGDPPLDFAGRLYQEIKSETVSWAIGEGSFVIVGLLEVLSGKENELKTRLKKNKKALQDKGKENKGTKIILEKIA